MTRHWTLDDIAWETFDRSKVDPELVKAVKAASMVEANAGDYVEYLRKVFHDDPKTIALFESWGKEETQHGEALGRWAEIVDPTFKFKEALAAFRAGYRPAHFDTGEGRRGSRTGEMISRCVVESGTSSYYSAMRDATDEPVLKQIVGHIAADEYRHWKLFYETMQAQTEKPMPLWNRLYVAVSRVNEAEDDELAYAYYCANTPLEMIGKAPYDRKAACRSYYSRVRKMFHERHLRKAMQMIAKAIGLHPQGILPKVASRVLWSYLQVQARLEPRSART